MNPHASLAERSNCIYAERTLVQGSGTTQFCAYNGCDMKKLLILCLALSVALVSCKKPADATAAKGDDTATVSKLTENAGDTKANKPATKADISYAFGVSLGKSFKDIGVELDYGSFLKGVKDQLDKGKTKITLDQAQTTIQEAITASTEKLREKNKADEQKFLTENKAKKGVITTASGLQYEVIKEGTGAKPSPESVVKVDYVGKLLDGSTFDSSIERGTPAEFPLNQVIPGWTEGLQLMTVGSKYKLYIPSELAYGPDGAGGGAIPGYSTLVFEVDLLEIEQ